MLMYIADGRFGNQIFQYLFLKTIQKNNEKLIVVGFDELCTVFNIKDLICISSVNTFQKYLFHFLFKKLLVLLSSKKIISSQSVIWETVLSIYQRETMGFNEKKGLFSRVKFVKTGFFQSEKCFDRNFAKTLTIKDTYLKEAEIFIREIPKGSHKVFVHVRLGDYNNFLVYGQSALLPMTYYFERMDWFLENVENPYFILLSDEPHRLKKEFSVYKNILISEKQHYGTDLAIMVQCDSAILSPSSFCWWGAYLMKTRHHVFVPKNWLGFKSGVDFSIDGACPSFAEKIEI